MPEAKCTYPKVSSCGLSCSSNTPGAYMHNLPMAMTMPCTLMPQCPTMPREASRSSRQRCRRCQRRRRQRRRCCCCCCQAPELPTHESPSRRREPRCRALDAAATGRPHQSNMHVAIACWADMTALTCHVLQHLARQSCSDMASASALGMSELP